MQVLFVAKADLPKNYFVNTAFQMYAAGNHTNLIATFAYRGKPGPSPTTLEQSVTIFQFIAI